MNKHQKKLKMLFTIVIVIFLTFSNLILIISEPSSNTVTAASTWTQTTEDDFKNGTFDSVNINGSGQNVNLIIDRIKGYSLKKVSASNEPPERADHGIATIWGTDKVVLFGGYDSNWPSPVPNYLNDTWIYDSSDNKWTQMNPQNMPSKRSNHAMAHIGGTDKVLLFGGDAEGYETWIYDFSDDNWTKKAPLTKPSSRMYHAMATIHGTDKVLLYGGSSGKNQTWIYDLSDNNWTKKNLLINPGNQMHHPISSIYGTDKILLFSTWNSKTWIYDFSDNEWTIKNTTYNPTGNYPYRMASFHGTDKIVLFGGRDELWTMALETWFYDLSENNWSKKNNISGSSSGLYVESGHALASFWGKSKVLFFGGYDDVQMYSEKTAIFTLYYSKKNGIFISTSQDLISNSTLKTINWNENISNNVTIKLQLRTAINDSSLILQDFVGPDGTTATYYNSSPANIWSGHDGDRWIQYKVYLNSTNINETPSLKNVTITYNVWPNTELRYPLNAGKINNNKPTFQWNFSDLDSTSQTAFQVLISNMSNFSIINYNSGEQISTNISWQFPNGTSYTSMTDGIWYWKVRAKDSEGDWGLYSSPYMLIIDTKLPSSSINYPVNYMYYNTLPTIYGIAHDLNGTGLEKVEINIKRLSDNYYWTGSEWSSIITWLLTSGNNSWSYNSSSITWPSGKQYLVRSRATDNTKNFELPGSGITFNIDFGKPSSMITVPSNNSYLNQLDTISGSSIDLDGSGLSNIKIYIKSEKDNTYWDGQSWTQNKCWLSTLGTATWSYDSSNVNWITNTYYSICSRAIDNIDNIEIPAKATTFMFDDQSPKELNIQINNDVEYTNSLTISLSLAANDISSGVYQMSFSTDNENWSPWELFNTTKALNLPAGDGDKTVYFKVRDRANNSIIASDTIILDTEPPNSLFVEINNDAQYTNSNVVELKLKAEDVISGVNKIALSTDGITWKTWENVDLGSETVKIYNNTKLYSLSPGDRVKSIYFKVQDNAGNIAEPVLDTITLDTSPSQNLSVIINENSKYTKTTNVSLKLNAFDPISGISEMSFSFSNNLWTPWEEFKNEIYIELPEGDGNKIVYFKVRDGADNIADFVSDSILLDTTPPFSLMLFINDGAFETNSTKVDLYHNAMDNLSGLDQISVSTDGKTWTPWEIFTQNSSFTLTGNDGEKTIYFRVMDIAGNIANPVSSKIILNTSTHKIKLGNINNTNGSLTNKTDDNNTNPDDLDTPKTKDTAGDTFDYRFLILAVVIIIILLLLFLLYIKNKPQVKNHEERIKNRKKEIKIKKEDQENINIEWDEFE